MRTVTVDPFSNKVGFSKERDKWCVKVSFSSARPAIRALFNIKNPTTKNTDNFMIPFPQENVMQFLPI